MKKIYGNKELLGTLNNMNRNGRMAQAVIFYGEKGSGKKLFADYYTTQLLCEAPVDGSPCGNCRSCRNAEKKLHPDVMYVQTEGKLGGYTKNVADRVISDAGIKPNNSTGRKIYIFRDCQNMNTFAQNAMLKLIEEPPEYAFFIFTAESKNEFLPTIISRCVCFGVSVCTEEEAEISLNESGFGKAEIAGAINCFHGNIGKCTEYITNERLRGQVDLTKRIADSIIRRDEYGLNAAFFSVGAGRSDIREILSMIDKLVRDAAVLGRDREAKTIGCFRDAAVKLSGIITAYQAMSVHDVIERAWGAVESNVSAPLVMAALCAEIMQIMN